MRWAKIFYTQRLAQPSQSNEIEIYKINLNNGQQEKLWKKSMKSNNSTGEIRFFDKLRLTKNDRMLNFSVQIMDETETVCTYDLDLKTNKIKESDRSQKNTDIHTVYDFNPQTQNYLIYDSKKKRFYEKRFKEFND